MRRDIGVNQRRAWLEMVCVRLGFGEVIQLELMLKLQVDLFERPAKQVMEPV